MKSKKKSKKTPRFLEFERLMSEARKAEEEQIRCDRLGTGYVGEMMLARDKKWGLMEEAKKCAGKRFTSFLNRYREENSEE